MFLQPGADGRATLGADLPADEAAEAYAVLDELAKMAKADGDERPIGQLRAELFSLLLRRPGGCRAARGGRAPDDHRHPGLPGRRSAAAGSVNGLAITAAHVRELLARIGALGLTCPEGGSLTFAISDADGRLLATTTVGELLRLARTGCPDHPDGDCGVPGARACRRTGTATRRPAGRRRS